jgi:lipopolysaccharide transport system ATP-binding protein
MASLLEVGTGFHAELTGRENIYMNGSILGMSKKEIHRKFDDIVAFAEMDQFLDTPVKRYSSGMYVRLAFAVAAHLDLEILLIDEVLAVGDLEFQKKCLGKMEAVANNGRTVLFVSHNMGSVTALCNRGIVLSGGHLVTHGPIDEVVHSYLRSLEKQASNDLASRTDRRGKGRIRLRQVQVSMGHGFPPGTLMMGQPACFVFELSEIRDNFDLSFTIYDHRGMAVSTLDTWRRAPYDCISSEVGNQVICHMDELSLRPGRYFLSAFIMHNKELQDQVDAAVFFDVNNGEYRGRPLPYPNIPGVVCLDHKWTIPTESFLPTDS